MKVVNGIIVDAGRKGRKMEADKRFPLMYFLGAAADQVQVYERLIFIVVKEPKIVTFIVNALNLGKNLLFYCSQKIFFYTERISEVVSKARSL